MPERAARRYVLASGFVLAVACVLVSADRRGVLAAQRVIGKDHPVLFSIPVGEDGITYCCRPRYGPEAIDVAPDGTFWIGDSAGHSVLRYSRDGRLLGRFATRSAIVDLAVSERSVWIIESSWEKPALARYDYSGNLVSVSALPPSMSSQSSDLFVGGERSVQVELARPPPTFAISWMDIDPSLLPSNSSPNAGRNSAISDLAASDPIPIPAKAVTHRSGRRVGSAEYTMTDGILSVGRRSVDVRGDFDYATLKRLSRGGLALVVVGYYYRRIDAVPGYGVARLGTAPAQPRAILWHRRGARLRSCPPVRSRTAAPRRTHGAAQ
jgi:hypothetical protein